MTVLVGVDGSACGRAALRWAARRARSSGGQLVAATTWQYPRTAALPGGPDLAPADDMDERAAELLRATVAEELGESAAEVATVVARGPAAWTLLDLIGEHGADLAVVGKRGLGPLSARVLGSVSRRVAELAPCPVAIVPERDPGDGPIVVGVDGSPAAERAVDVAIEVARTEEGATPSIIVVHGIAGLPAELAPSAVDRFVGRAHELVDRLAARASDAGVPASTFVDVADPRTLLRVVAEQRGARMIVIGSEGDGPASGVMTGGVVNHVAQQSDRPVVVVPDR